MSAIFANGFSVSMKFVHMNCMKQAQKQKLVIIDAVTVVSCIQKKHCFIEMLKLHLTAQPDSIKRAKYDTKIPTTTKKKCTLTTNQRS